MCIRDRVSALTNFFSTDQAIGYGLITLLLVGLVGGVAFYLMYYFVYQYYGPDTDRSQRPPFWKSILVILAAMPVSYTHLDVYKRQVYVRFWMIVNLHRLSPFLVLKQ